MSGEYREYSSEDKRRLDRLGLDSNRYKGNYSAEEVEGAYRNQLDKPMSGLEQDALYRAYGALKSKAPREHIDYVPPKKGIIERCFDVVFDTVDGFCTGSYCEAEKCPEFKIPVVARGTLEFLEDFTDKKRWRFLVSLLCFALAYYTLMTFDPAYARSVPSHEALAALLQTLLFALLGIILLLLSFINMFLPILNGLLVMIIEAPIKIVVGLDYRLWRRNHNEESECLSKPN